MIEMQRFFFAHCLGLLSSVLFLFSFSFVAAPLGVSFGMGIGPPFLETTGGGVI